MRDRAARGRFAVRARVTGYNRAVRPSRAALVPSLLALLLTGGCPEESSAAAPVVAPAPSPPPPWPALPTTADEARSLIAERTARPVELAPELTAERVRRALLVAVEAGTLVVGWDAIAAWLGDRLAPRAVVLFGSWHDARLQIEAFRRLVGPAGMARRDVVVAMEQLDSDGRWGGVEEEGDSAPLSWFLSNGGPEALTQIDEAQRRNDYTAWKYDYVDVVIDVLTAARATGQRVVGCDVPPATQRRMAGIDESASLRVRELHCVLSLEDAELGDAPVVAFWGSAHVRADGLPRFFAADRPVTSVHVVGGRTADHGLEVALAEGLAIAEPVLSPLGGDELVLLLPDRHLGIRLDRRRSTPTEASEAPVEAGLVASSSEPGELVLPHARLAVGESLVQVTRPPSGPIGYAFAATGRRTLIGGITRPPGGRVELHLEPGAPMISQLTIAPDPR